MNPLSSSSIHRSRPTPLTANRLAPGVTSTRESSRLGLGAQIKTGFVHVARAAEQGLAVAAPLVPAGAVLSAAVAGTSRAMLPSEALVAPGAGGEVSQLMDATRQMTELNASYNLRYLQLQQQIQADTREFNLVSNVLKTKHDAAKNALANIR